MVTITASLPAILSRHWWRWWWWQHHFLVDGNDDLVWWFFCCCWLNRIKKTKPTDRHRHKKHNFKEEQLKKMGRPKHTHTNKTPTNNNRKWTIWFIIDNDHHLVLSIVWFGCENVWCLCMSVSVCVCVWRIRILGVNSNYHILAKVNEKKNWLQWQHDDEWINFQKKGEKKCPLPGIGCFKTFWKMLMFHSIHYKSRHIYTYKQKKTTKIRWSQSFQMRNYWWQRLMEHYIGQKTMYSWPTIMMMTETRNFLSFFSWWHRQTKFFFSWRVISSLSLGPQTLAAKSDRQLVSFFFAIHSSFSLSHSLQV